MLKVWGRKSSANVQKVMWLLGEIGLEHEHIPAGGPYGGLNDPKFRAMNPNGLVPVIDDEGLILWESNAVVRYLAAAYGGALWPASPHERAPIDQWMEWSSTTFQPAIIGLFWGYWRTPEKDRNGDAIRGFQQKVADNLRLLDDILAARPFIAGDAFSLADIPNGVHLYRYYTMGLDVPKLAHVEAWYERLKARPAYAGHVMVSYEELRGRLTF
jgi:glutathione S-transferase